MYRQLPTLISRMLSAVVLLALAATWQLTAAEPPPSFQPYRGKIAASAADSTPDLPRPTSAPAGAPSIILILLDDVGFGAASCFGGPIHTPNLDHLAAQGLRYNNFNVTAQCAPTRGALLTGRNDHHTGFGTVSFGGYPGYNNVIRKSTALFADVLRRNGYSTAALGKWHNTPLWETSPIGPFDRWPTGLGFEYFYGFMGALDSQWDPALYRNTTAVDPPAVPAAGYYLTTDLVDESIHWIQTHESLAPQKPYLLYLATGATHEPHHVGKEWIEKYKGRFDRGWDDLRAEIFERQKRLGVIPADAALTPRPAELPGWDTYSAQEHKLLAHQMEVYAGFLEETDHEIGRLINVAQRLPSGKNTIVFCIVGDNGASAEGGLHGDENFHTRLDTPQPIAARLLVMDELGGPGHFNHYASGWAYALCSPFKWEKLIASHFGGTRNPLLISWPGHLKQTGGLRPQFTDVTDLAATIYDLTRVPFPTSVDGVEQLPLDGVSFADTLDRPDAPSRHHLQIFEQWGNRAIYQDGWIAATRHQMVPWRFSEQRYNFDYTHDHWELYHVAVDFSEAHDLASQMPDKLKAMQALFDQEAWRNEVYPLGGSSNGTDIPKVADDKKVIVYYPGMPRLLPSMGPNFGVSHRITAEAVIPSDGASGVIISEGRQSGGFVLYVKDNHLVYENNTTLAHDVITSNVPLHPGRISLAYEFVREGAGGGGTGRLLIDGQTVGEIRLAHAAWNRVSGYNMPGTFGIGRAFGSPVSHAYESPFAFTGVLEQVRVEMK
jgi:arylsulfatase